MNRDIGTLSRMPSVHRIRHLSAEQVAEQNRKRDDVPVIERYQDLAAALHRTAVSPCGNQTIWGCLCGMSGKIPDSRLEAGALAARRHVFDEATKLHDKLEGDNPSERND